jgi:hypothetical protein
MRKASDRVRHAGLEELTDGSHVRSACDVCAQQPFQVQVNVNVQALRLEYKSGWFDFFRTEPRTRRLALDRFTVEIAAETTSSDVPALIEKITSWLDIVPPRHLGTEISETAVSGHRAPSAYAAVCDDDPSSVSRRTGAALDIWV